MFVCLFLFVYLLLFFSVHLVSSRLQELLALQLANEKEAWDGEGERARILQGLEKVRNMDEAHMFLEPVDLEVVPDYCRVVPFPTDLKTISCKLENNLYR